MKILSGSRNVGLKMQNFQAGFELKNFEVGKIVSKYWHKYAHIPHV